VNVKDYTPEDVSFILGNDFKTAPMLHQGITLIWAADKSRVMLWHDIGTGKTLTALYLHQLWGSERILVACPNAVVESWADQIREHTNSDYCLLTGPMDRRRALLKEQHSIYVVNHEAIPFLFGETVGKRWRPDLKAIFAAGFDGLIVDEVHYYKNQKAKRSRAMKEISQRVSKTIGMTGTPYGTGEEDLYSQYEVLGRADLLGSRRKFLEKHFSCDYWNNWTIKPGERDVILDRVEPCTLRYAKAECFDLPELVFEERRCDLSSEQKKIIAGMVDGSGATVKDKILTVPDTLNLGNRLAQVAGGFVIERGDPVRLESNPKLDLLRSVLAELLPVGKIIIFHSYVEEGRMIESVLDVPFVSLRGEVKDKACWKRFVDDDAIKILVAHPKSGGEGLNLQACSQIVFYSNGCWGAQVREQAVGRIWRHGQGSACLVVDLIARDSIDEQRLDRMADRADVAQAVLAYAQGFSG